MTVRKTLVSLAVLGLLAAASPAAALEWSDNAFHLSWGANYREPGAVKAGTTDPLNISKTTLNFTHASGDKLGDNFLSLDMYISNGNDPAAGSAQGATEVYAVFRRSFSLNRITDSKMFTFTGVRDVRLEGGLDIGTKNNTFASHKVMPALGASLALDVPGFLNVGAFITKEWNNNGFMHASGTVASGGEVVFEATPAFFTAWGIPLGSLPLELDGFANVILPKGRDGFGNKTATEVVLQPTLMWNVTQGFTGKKGSYELGVGYQYWLNKYGNDNSLTVNGVKVNSGALASTVFVQAAVHL
jgi:hypothetical protein